MENNIVKQLLFQYYGIDGRVDLLYGEFDLNYKVYAYDKKYVLKISRSNPNIQEFDFQQSILQHLSEKDINSPQIIPTKNGEFSVDIFDDKNERRLVRLLSWIDGQLWTNVNPITSEHLSKLGKENAQITKALSDFNHPFAHRNFEWDLSQVEWTFEHIDKFTLQQQKLVSQFIRKYKTIKPDLASLRSGTVHNDINNNNILIGQDGSISCIDYGDAIHTHIINDLAITIAYGIMQKPCPLDAACTIVYAYNLINKLSEKEISCLYVLVSMRLLTTVTKAAINKIENPSNPYLWSSEKDAWNALYAWSPIPEELAVARFRHACSYSPIPEADLVFDYLNKQQKGLHDLFNNKEKIIPVDMSVASTWLGHKSEYEDEFEFNIKLLKLQNDDEDAVITGGYMEPRSFYTTDAYLIETNDGPEYRSKHLGVDFWLPAESEIKSILDGVVILIKDNDFDKDYGPTIILRHQIGQGKFFYTLYGHLTRTSLNLHQVGDTIKAGDLVGFIGHKYENGNWAPHLHFQIMLDLLGNKENFPGVCRPSLQSFWEIICPDPQLLFSTSFQQNSSHKNSQNLLSSRKTHLGRSLSISYKKPLYMVRGDGAYLIDNLGQKYLDTVNNVAHVGHEHKRVVQAGKTQMSLLNTNTRYLHHNIVEFAKKLVSKMPKELSVVHFVNSGSEANELALRMSMTCSGQKDIIALQHGYHGNTNLTIDVSSYKFEGKGGKPCPETTHLVPAPDAFRGLYRGENTGTQYAKHIQDKIEELATKGRSPAAFIAESILSCGGQIELPPDYLRTVYSSIRAAGGYCIADEVQVGLGRVGSHYSAFELYGVVPDIVTFGKPLGNGHPVAAVVCTADVADGFANGMEYFNTFGGNPVSSAIGLEVLKIVEKESLQEHASYMGEYLKKEFRNMAKDFPIIADVRGQGLFLGIELCDEQRLSLAKQTDYMINRMRDYNILMSWDGPDHNVLKLKPPMVFSKQNADELLTRLNQVFKEDPMRI